MTSPNDPSFEFITALQMAKAKAEDLARHGRASQGLETGDGSHHKGSDKLRSRIEANKPKALTALDIALQNDSYASLYNDVRDFLKDAALEVDDALTKMRWVLSRAAQTVETTLDAASDLPDGTKVFHRRDGKVFDEHDREVGKDEAATIIWITDSPDYETYLRQREAVATAQQRVDDLQGLQTGIADAQERMENPDRPASEDELKRTQSDFEDRLEKKLQREPTGGAEFSSEVSTDVLPRL